MHRWHYSLAAIWPLSYVQTVVNGKIEKLNEVLTAARATKDSVKDQLKSTSSAETRARRTAILTKLKAERDRNKIKVSEQRPCCLLARSLSLSYSLRSRFSLVPTCAFPTCRPTPCVTLATSSLCLAERTRPTRPSLPRTMLTMRSASRTLLRR